MSAPKAPHLSIIIPAYKEAGTIGDSLEKLAAYIAFTPSLPSTEVIVSVGQSPDETITEAKSKRHLFRHFTVLDNGLPADKGRNVKLGVLQAKGEVVMYMDADLSTPLHHLPAMLELLQKYDVVIAERNVEQIHGGHRKFISMFGNLLVQIILLPGMKDTQCGFKGFRRTAARQLFRKQRTISWGFDMEILALAKKYGFSSQRFAVTDWVEVKKGGQLDGGIIKAFRAAIYTFTDLMKIRWYLTTNRYAKNEGEA